MYVIKKGLSEIAILYPDAIDTLEGVKSLGLKAYLITNGLANVQRGRLRLSGIGKYFDGIFISDEMGTSKPSKKYYDMVVSQIDGFDSKKALIVGDSLVSDIPLGLENGIDTCYLNHTSEKPTLPVTCEIRTVSEVLNIIK